MFVHVVYFRWYDGEAVEKPVSWLRANYPEAWKQVKDSNLHLNYPPSKFSYNAAVVGGSILVRIVGGVGGS